jgi:hypothetical protein
MTNRILEFSVNIFISNQGELTNLETYYVDIETFYKRILKYNNKERISEKKQTYLKIHYQKYYNKLLTAYNHLVPILKTIILKNITMAHLMYKINKVNDTSLPYFQTYNYISPVLKQLLCKTFIDEQIWLFLKYKWYWSDTINIFMQSKDELINQHNYRLQINLINRDINNIVNEYLNYDKIKTCNYYQDLTVINHNLMLSWYIMKNQLALKGIQFLSQICQEYEYDSNEFIILFIQKIIKVLRKPDYFDNNVNLGRAIDNEILQNII